MSGVMVTLPSGIGKPTIAKLSEHQEKLPIVVSHEFASSVASSCFQRPPRGGAGFRV